MLHLSKKSLYAIRAVLELARRQDRDPTTMADIAAAQRIPPKFLAVILGQLKQAGFVASVRGTRGGYTLARPPERLSVGEVIAQLEGPGEHNPFRLRHARAAQRPERLAEATVLGEAWLQAEQAVQQAFGRVTFRELVQRTDLSVSALTGTYSI
jgi:Rrf2 family protein